MPQVQPDPDTFNPDIVQRFAAGTRLQRHIA
jgi:hypothetical protein